MKIVGKQTMSFKSKETGELITGIKLHYSEENDKVQGLAVGTEFVVEAKDCYNDALSLPLNASVQFIYNKYGKVDGIVLLEKK